MVNTKLFEGEELPLVIYNGQAIIDMALGFYTVIDCLLIPYEKIPYDFPDYVSSYLRVYNERGGREIIELALSRSNEYLIVNASVLEMTFEDNGNYFYEIGYVRAVYEQTLRYGTLSVI